MGKQGGFTAWSHQRVFPRHNGFSVDVERRKTGDKATSRGYATPTLNFFPRHVNAYGRADKLPSVAVRKATASAVIRLVSYTVLVPLVTVAGNKSHFGRTGPGGMHLVPDLSYWPNATLWRFLQLSDTSETAALSHLTKDPESANSQAAQFGILFQHIDNDEYCSCRLKSCAGSLPAEAGRLQVSLTVAGFLIAIFHDFTNMYTQMVTFASSFWTGWGIFLGALARGSHF